MIMRNRLNLSPKAKTTVSVKRTLVYASVGAGLFVVLFTGAFFYLNMGNSEDSLAAPSTIIANPGGGAWTDATSWNLGRIPVDGDVIEIPSLTTVTIIKNPDIILNNIEIKVFGVLSIAGSLTLNESSRILIDEKGDI